MSRIPIVAVSLGLASLAWWAWPAPLDPGSAFAPTARPDNPNDVPMPAAEPLTRPSKADAIADPSLPRPPAGGPPGGAWAGPGPLAETGRQRPPPRQPSLEEIGAAQVARLAAEVLALAEGRGDGPETVDPDQEPGRYQPLAPTASLPAEEAKRREQLLRDRRPVQLGEDAVAITAETPPFAFAIENAKLRSGGLDLGNFSGRDYEILVHAPNGPVLVNGVPVASGTRLRLSEYARVEGPDGSEIQVYPASQPPPAPPADQEDPPSMVPEPEARG